MPKYICGATSDIGVGREQQEDFVQFCELDEETLLCIVADGTGSMPQRPQPASIVAMDIIENIKDSFGKKPDLLIKYPKFFLEKAMNDANRIFHHNRSNPALRDSGFPYRQTAVFQVRVLLS